MVCWNIIWVENTSQEDGDTHAYGQEKDLKQIEIMTPAELL